MLYGFLYLWLISHKVENCEGFPSLLLFDTNISNSGFPEHEMEMHLMADVITVRVRRVILTKCIFYLLLTCFLFLQSRSFKRQY